jgi:hypothetical protein
MKKSISGGEKSFSFQSSLKWGRRVEGFFGVGWLPIHDKKSFGGRRKNKLLNIRFQKPRDEL